MTNAEQLEAWLAGTPIHNEEGGGDGKGECTPDFSCCVPSLLVRREVRAAFVQGDEDARLGLLNGFLRALLEHEGHRVV